MGRRDLGEIARGYIYGMTLELLVKDKNPYLVSSENIFNDLTRLSNANGYMAKPEFSIFHAMLPESRIKQYRHWFYAVVLNGKNIEEIVEDDSNDLAKITGNRLVKRIIWATSGWLKEYSAAPGDDVIMSARIPTMNDWANELSSKLYERFLGRLNYEF